jgi:D-beta-D-heptose 7-phosphate kinase/D-beta-D-heptose 1-phosphate adenosyltransferase
MRLDHEDRNKSNMHGELLKRVIKYAKNSDLIILSDYDKGSVKFIAADIISFANKNNIKVIIDPKGTDYSMYENAYMLKPNELEFP